MREKDKAIKEKTEQIKLLQEAKGPEQMMEIKSRQKELEVLFYQENLRWKHRAKKHSFKEGDRNTKFFHACANQRRRKNAIVRI